RYHVAEFLVYVGQVLNKQQAFIIYCGAGKPAAVPREWAALEEHGAAMNEAAGMVVSAHPRRYVFSATAKRNLFEEFKSLGGQGIEVHSGKCNKNDRLNYALLGQHYGLLVSAGSEFHRLNDYSGGILGACPELPDICRPVWE
ncbi:phosphatase, partial [Neisseria zoodegmatis]